MKSKASSFDLAVHVPCKISGICSILEGYFLLVCEAYPEDAWWHGEGFGRLQWVRQMRSMARCQEMRLCCTASWVRPEARRVDHLRLGRVLKARPPPPEAATGVGDPRAGLRDDRAGERHAVSTPRGVFRGRLGGMGWRHAESSAARSKPCEITTKA